jgi:hypothetical protein
MNVAETILAEVDRHERAMQKEIQRHAQSMRALINPDDATPSLTQPRRKRKCGVSPKEVRRTYADVVNQHAGAAQKEVLQLVAEIVWQTLPKEIARRKISTVKKYLFYPGSYKTLNLRRVPNVEELRSKGFPEWFQNELKTF